MYLVYGSQYLFTSSYDTAADLGTSTLPLERGLLQEKALIVMSRAVFVCGFLK